MKASVKTALLLSVAVIAVSACSSSKGPGELGNKNDIVVRNYGEPRDTAPATAGDFSSTVETAAAVPPAEVGAGEPVAPVDGSTVATQEQAQAVAEQSAPVPPTTSAPMNDGTPVAATAPAQQSTAETPVPAEPVTQTASPQQLQSEPYQTPRVQAGDVSTAPAVVANAPAAQPVAQPYVSAPETIPLDPSEQPFIQQAPQPVAQPQSAHVQEPAAIAVPKNPNGSFYEYMKAGQSSGVTASGSATTSAIAASGDVAKVKAALAAKGLYSGVQNDVIDSEFLNALSKYQGENGLPMGSVNAQTKQHLGITQ